MKLKKLFIAGALFAGIASASAQNIKSEIESKAYSDPIAPVGNKMLTVPPVVKPILNQWMRDTYVTYGPDGNYYLMGTTTSPTSIPKMNDGLYLWRSHDMKRWEALGRIWSLEKDAAAWQKNGIPIKPGGHAVIWAPELHYIKSKKQWLIIACLNGKNGSFILRSTSGKPQGPYENIIGNANKPIFPEIDGSLFEDDDGKVYVIGHNHYIARMNDELTDLAEPFQKFIETPYHPEPYIEGVYMVKYNRKYQLLQTVWSVKKPDGSYSYLRAAGEDDNLHSYDVVVAEADNIYGPYGSRYPAILQGGHNDLFTDKNGDWWSTTFFNPRGECGKIFPVTCRPAVVAVKWVEGKLMPDRERNNKFYGND